MPARRQRLDLVIGVPGPERRVLAVIPAGALPAGPIPTTNYRRRPISGLRKGRTNLSRSAGKAHANFHE